MNNNTPPKHSLISSHTILILSFFLIGMVVGRMVEAHQLGYAFATGFMGIASYIVLNQWDKRREEKKTAMNAERAMQRLKGRIDKLITRESLIPYSRLFPKKEEDSIQQYVTVTHSQKRPKCATRFASARR